MMLGPWRGGAAPMEIDCVAQKGDEGKTKGKAKDTYNRGKGNGDAKNSKSEQKGQQKGQDYGQGKNQRKGQKGKGDGGPVKTYNSSSRVKVTLHQRGHQQPVEVRLRRPLLLQ